MATSFWTTGATSTVGVGGGGACCFLVQSRGIGATAESAPSVHLNPGRAIEPTSRFWSVETAGFRQATMNRRRAPTTGACEFPRAPAFRCRDSMSVLRAINLKVDGSEGDVV